ncbi:iron complex outermembrane recepter protein [bacterium A37T11]|nr:iron complex outermembrane recepter protein [bacterium A37T11]
MDFPKQIKKIIPCLFCCAFTGWLYSPVSAQQTGEAKGYVYGPSNEPIAHATVSLEGRQTETLTNEDGYFIFDNLPFGTYPAHIRMVGYQTLISKIIVRPDAVNGMRFTINPNPQMLSPVTVTAEKKQADMQKVPLPLTVISGRQIEERNIREVSDLLLASPNTMTFNAGAPTLNLISIRGVATYTTDPAIGVYVDGVPMFDGYSSSIQLQNIDRVEVLRGPQGTLYGRTGLGGVINIITRSPTNVTQGFASVGLSNYGSQQYALGFSGPLVKNKLFAGISALYDTRNGYFKNLYTGKDFDKPRTYTMAMLT